jgi:hypothetical protein
MNVAMMIPPLVEVGAGVALGVTGVRVRVWVGWGGNVGGRGVALGGTGLSVDVGSSVAVEVDGEVDREVDRGVELGGSGV